MTELDDCFDKGLLKMSLPDIAKARASLKIAKANLQDGKTHLANKMYNWGFIASYTSMFHCARALLFKDGLKERSHYCLCSYVREKYLGIIEMKYLNELDILREQRHRIFYGDDEVVVKEVLESEADSAVKLSEGFMHSVIKIINAKN